MPDKTKGSTYCPKLKSDNDPLRKLIGILMKAYHENIHLEML